MYVGLSSCRCYYVTLFISSIKAFTTFVTSTTNQKIQNMRLIILTFLLGANLIVLAQTHAFKPQWKPGMEKVLSISQIEREYENDE